ncbi:hypothetical protein [Draconibacterium sediminis]|uniref:Ppx/GppA phosphatase domain-containing protein n=1 Tax=Draconibacterium sediminis TaxID=1544798 RepID=A0A0D8JBK3_9BACT|nr:hypothetical protein [Draconibacterium sediminis]KJF44272.1 hypothetical protein LH29_01785 [Draconibacterium sediminis]
MAKKVLRIHSGAVNTGWFNSTPPSPNAIAEISSNNKTGKVATSIPSPFARIDLVKNAFKEIADSGNLDGTEDNHKLVSDALDVAQLFFEFDQVKNRYPNAEIIAWNPVTDVQSAQSIANTKIFADTLELFWKQDGSTYNFNLTNHLFILKINYKVIGATSPATLFFAAPDAHRTDLNFSFGNVVLFDANYEAIYDRDDEFIEFIYAMYKQPNFASLFPEVYDYLTKALATIQQQNPTLWNKLMQFSQNTLSTFTPLNVTGLPLVNVCGLTVCKNVLNPVIIESNSGFTIKASKNISNLKHKPLVLPVEKFFSAWVYTKSGSVWDSTTTVPESDPTPVSKRILPGQAVQYPYLTMNDFLEDAIIKLPYEINKDAFDDCEFGEYLLPLKPLFFELFDNAELVSNNMIQIDTTVPNAVRVSLTIPTASGAITYNKLYRQDSIYERDFHLGMFPLIESHEHSIPINYHVGLVDNEDGISIPFTLELWEKSHQLQNLQSVTRKEKVVGLSSVSYKSREFFDKIKIVSSSSSGTISGFIIPKFRRYQPSSTIAKIAFDFGTTNTHIEFKYDAAAEKPFETEGLYASFSREVSIADHILADKLLKMEIFPDKIHKESQCNYPLRTALLTNQNTNWGANPETFQDSNVAFYYEKEGSQEHHEIVTDLKWRNLSNPIEGKKLQHFIDGMLEGVKYNLLSDGIYPAKAEITWLYPISMSINQKNQLSNIWTSAVNNQFGSSTKVFDFPESIAPYQYYAKNMGLMGLTASIDIGGGSSDISVFDHQNPILISSVSFAGNAVVGDGYNSNLEINGFYRQFKDRFNHSCDLNEGSEQKVILNQIINGKNPSSSNFSSFLFSVEKSIFNYGDELTHSNLKFLYLIFYAAQAYSLAKTMKGIGSAKPSNIIFSGSGSKSLNILDSDRKSRTLTKGIFDYIFDAVYDSEDADIRIELTDQPKEVSCKGALNASAVNLIGKIGFWLGGNNSNDKVCYSDSDSTPALNYTFTSDFKTDIINSVKDFFTIFDAYVKKHNLTNYYGIDNDVMNVFVGMREKHLEDYLDAGLKLKSELASSNDETLTEGAFFYPLVGLINRLGTELTEGIDD